jgi:hypothetical protein
MYTNNKVAERERERERENLGDFTTPLVKIYHKKWMP